MQKSVIGFQCSQVSHDIFRKIMLFSSLVAFSAFLVFLDFCSLQVNIFCSFPYCSVVLIPLNSIILQDPTFAREFIKRKGTDYLVKIVETENQ